LLPMARQIAAPTLPTRNIPSALDTDSAFFVRIKTL
jgi:hypothetical protein